VNQLNEWHYQPNRLLTIQEHLDTAQEFIAGAIQELSGIGDAFRFVDVEDVISKLRESQCAIDQLRAKVQEHEGTRAA
jgi:hypothetical protein